MLVLNAQYLYLGGMSTSILGYSFSQSSLDGSQLMAGPIITYLPNTENFPDQVLRCCMNNASMGAEVG